MNKPLAAIVCSILRSGYILICMASLLSGCEINLYQHPRFIAKTKSDGVVQKTGLPYEPIGWYDYHSFAVVPFSTLTDTPPDSLERRILAALYGQLSQAFYRPTSFDSADVIVTVKLTNDVLKSEYPHVTYFVPTLRPISAFTPLPSDSIHPSGVPHRVAPRIEFFVYDRHTAECLGQFLATAIDTAIDYEVAAEKLLPVLVRWRLPRNIGGQDSLVGRGMAGIGFSIALDGSQHFWPVITEFTENSAASHSRFRVNDTLTRLNGESLEGESAVGFFLRMKGDIGRRIVLEAKRGNRTIVDTLTYTVRPNSK